MGKMRNIFVLILIGCLFSCVPVLTKNLMQQGRYTSSLSDVKQNPFKNKGTLFIFGGIIVKTTLTREGSLIEAIFVPVNSLGYLKSYGIANERFLALYRGRELLDPLIYREKREVTIAGEFIELRNGAIGEMEYTYPLFEIKDIYLWQEYELKDYYPYPLYYPPSYYRYRYYPFYDPYPW